MVNGNNARVQLAVESVYGTLLTMVRQIRISSEGFKWTPEKKEEGLLTGGKATGRVYTSSVKAEGSLSTNVRPDEAGYWIGAAFGKEATVESAGTTAKKHTFTTVSSTESLPSLSFTIDRLINTYAYIGCKVGSLSFSAQPGDYLKLDLSLAGKDEIAGTIAAGLTPSPLKPFRFAGASVKVDGSAVADVTSVKYDHNNNLDHSVQTTSTGLYFKEPECGARDIKVNLEVIYSIESDDIRDTFFKTDDLVAVELNFESDEEIETGVVYSLKILLPNCQIEDMGPANISGADTLKQSLTLRAIEEGSDELVTAELINGFATKYV